MLVVIGPAREDDDEYFLEFTTAISQTPRTHYLPPVAHPKLIAAINQADILLNTSTSEGASNAILEAMKLGTPV